MWMKTCIQGLSSWLSSMIETKSDTGSPLPSVVHKLLPLSQLKQRLVIVSDVHGCLDEVQALLQKIHYSPDTTTVIFVGDLVAKGPKSAETIDWLTKQSGMYAVRGNHEDNALLAIHEKTSKYAKKDAYNFVTMLSPEQQRFIKELPVTITIPELQLLVVHAGLDPGKRGLPIQHQAFSDLIRIRCVDFAGTTSNKNPKPNQLELWGDSYKGPPFVVFGHDAKRKLQVHSWARGIDTGCVYGGSLTGLIIENTHESHNWKERIEIVSVPAAKVYVGPDDD